MLDYKLAPVNLAPAYRPGLGFPAIPRRLAADGGGSSTGSGGSSGDLVTKARSVLGAGAVTIVVGTALSAGTAWVGFSTGAREQGFLSGLGYIVGAIGALTAIGGMAGLVAVGIASLALPDVIQAPPPAQPPSRTSPFDVANA